MTTGKVKIKLQGHEKFALREGWVNKALMLLPDNADAFTRKDATDLFGIGSNMVKSLRYWMKAFGLTNVQGTELSDVGKLIAKYDPYLENRFSLWIMHSHIAKNKEDIVKLEVRISKANVNLYDRISKEIDECYERINFEEKEIEHYQYLYDKFDFCSSIINNESNSEYYELIYTKS